MYPLSPLAVVLGASRFPANYSDWTDVSCCALLFLNLVLGATLRPRQLTGVPGEGQAITAARGKQTGSQLSLYQSRNHSTCMKASAGQALRRRQQPGGVPGGGCRRRTPTPTGHTHPSSARRRAGSAACCPPAVQQAGMGDKQGGTLPNDGQGSEVLAGAACPPQGLVCLAEAAGPQGSAFGAAGPELGRASIKSNRVVCCGWEPGF